MDKFKVATIALGVALLVALAFILKLNIDIAHKQTALEQSVLAQKEITAQILRSSSEYASKSDIENLAKENKLNIDAISNDLKSIGARVEAINNIKVVSNGVVATNIGSTSHEHTTDHQPVNAKCPDGTSVNCPNIDQFGYIGTKQDLKLTEPFSDINVPIGEVSFSAEREKPWDINILPRKYSVTTVIGVNEDGLRHQAYSQFNIDVDGKTYTAKISSGQLLEEYPEAKFSFNVRPYLGFHAGVTSIGSLPHADMLPSLTLSLFSYGKTKSQPDLTFLNIGAGYMTSEKNPSLVLIPVNYNLSNIFSILHNTYIGPSLSLDKDRNLMIGLGFSVGL